jgi:hypothetical protein
MASRMVFSSNDVCGFAGLSELPITVYPRGAADGSQVSIAWSLSISNAKQLAADLLASIKAVEEAPPVQACAQCGSPTGVQLEGKGCTQCPNVGTRPVL